MGSQKKGLVQRIERKLEATVDDAFARIFGGSIVRQEVEAMLRREAADGVRSLPGNHLLAPNEYIITLGVHDFDKVGTDPDLTSDTLADNLMSFIYGQRWQTYGDVAVRFERSPSLRTGQFRVRGAVNPDVESRQADFRSAQPQPDPTFSPEPGALHMTENSSYRAGQGHPAFALPARCSKEQGVGQSNGHCRIDSEVRYYRPGQRCQTGFIGPVCGGSPLDQPIHAGTHFTAA